MECGQGKCAPESDEAKSQISFDEYLADRIWDCILFGKTEMKLPNVTVSVDYTQPPGCATVEGTASSSTIGGQTSG